MDNRAISGLALSWTGTLATISLHDVLAVVGLAASIAGSIYAVQMTRAKLHSERISQAKLETELCEDCRLGTPPGSCPIEPAHRPKDCPLQ